MSTCHVPRGSIEESEALDPSSLGAGPLFDLNDPAVRRAITLGKRCGFVTYDELNRILPSDRLPEAAIECSEPQRLYLPAIQRLVLEQPQSPSTLPYSGQGEVSRVFNLKDQVSLKAGGQTVMAEVIGASENGRSLTLGFDATLFGITGKMAVVQGDDGQWTSVFGHHTVKVEWRPRLPDE